MTILCEIVESYVAATSSIPEVQVSVVVVGAALGQSAAVTGNATIVVSTASGANVLDLSSHAALVSSGQAASVISYHAEIAKTAISESEAVSTPFVGVTTSEVSTGAASSTVSYHVDNPVFVSSAVGSNTSTTTVAATISGVSSAAGQSSILTGGTESVTGTSASVSTVTFTRRFSADLVSSAASTSVVSLSDAPRPTVHVSAGAASSAVFIQVAMNSDFVSEADASSGVWYKDPNRVAWVLNTETSAACWYNNFDFESIAQPPGKVLAVGPDGIYELTGDTDTDELIDASVVSGFDDFGDAQTKRMDALYFGYTSDGQLSVGVETYGSGHGPSTYNLEQRDADAPRTSRVVPGKGLFGRYWRTTINNVDGADFHVFDTTTDIATSTRRL